MLHKLFKNNFKNEVAHTVSIVEMQHKIAELLQNLNKPIEDQINVQISSINLLLISLNLLLTLKRFR